MRELQPVRTLKSKPWGSSGALNWQKNETACVASFSWGQLEQQFQCELHLTRRHIRFGGRDHAKRSSRHSVSGLAEVWSVRHVEEFRPELQFPCFSDREILEQRYIQCSRPRS